MNPQKLKVFSVICCTGETQSCTPLTFISAALDHVCGCRHQWNSVEGYWWPCVAVKVPQGSQSYFYSLSFLKHGITFLKHRITLIDTYLGLEHATLRVFPVDILESGLLFWQMYLHKISTEKYGSFFSLNQCSCAVYKHLTGTYTLYTCPPSCIMQSKFKCYQLIFWFRTTHSSTPLPLAPEKTARCRCVDANCFTYLLVTNDPSSLSRNHTQCHLYHKLIDWTKVFDRSWHEYLWQLMRIFNLDSTS